MALPVIGQLNWGQTLNEFLKVGRRPPYYIPGSYYGPADSWEQAGGDLGAVDTLRLSPWPVYEALTFDRIGVNHWNASTASALARLCVFRDDGVQGGTLAFTLVLDAGTVDLSTAVGRKELAINWAATPALYWVGVRAEGATPGTARLSRLVTANRSGLEFMPRGNSSNFTVAVAGFVRSGLIGALASLTPARADFEVGGDFPMVWLRAV